MVMTESQAHQMLAELVRLRGDVERFQRALAALGTVQEVRSSAMDQLGRHAYDAHRKYVAQEALLVKLLSGASDMLSSVGDHDPDVTNPRV